MYIVAMDDFVDSFMVFDTVYEIKSSYCLDQ